MTANDNLASPLEMDCRAVKARMDSGESFLFLDCREPDEYSTAHIEGTVLLPMSELAQRIGELELHRNSAIVVHCHHGGRSMRVTKWLRQQGFPRVTNMAGGIDDWSQQIDPTIPRY
jgi:rhodanese-related sulfurtransferase